MLLKSGGMFALLGAAAPCGWLAALKISLRIVMLA